MQVRHTLKMAAWALVLAQAGAIASAPAAESQYPARPITIIVGYAAGGGNDVLARIVAEEMSKGLKQPVIVENRPGVASIVGAAYVAKAKPDGYTLFWGASGPISFNPALYSKLPYKVEDFTPVSLTAKFPLVLVSDASLPIKSVPDLVAYSKQHPDKANYGSSAASFQLVTELFNARTGARFSHIPYKGSNESIQSVMAGNVTMAITDPAPATVGLQSKRIRALAVTSAQRADFLPEVPTMRESGIDLEVELWAGLLAPAGTPEAVVATLQKEIERVVALPQVRSKMAGLGCVAAATSSSDFRRLIEAEVPFWTKVAKENNIKMD
ncbi:MAG: tripartite tricarboxylate transporter substrate binding protein [Pigmentiphaga sp.]|uniref:Bug family tripartite tricarboxylate transporter substrate binding protein n=1 Tax=Pigmentiphaga sp. TaxID=1977564 RepID=UPI0029AB8D97|nr:tripartite tricarboxylate transporter substrate binding protein [Pigmentiphaga sp.]MDX3906929.1 tripartite tricarboxylate transporter substrate binding protein [Pigmentiphaga sp.]